MHNKLPWKKIWILNCLLFVYLLLNWLPLKLYIILINIVQKGFWYPVLYSDWYPMLLFESSLLSAFWNVLSYSVILAYSVSDFEKYATLFRYFSLLCYLEQSKELMASTWSSKIITSWVMSCNWNHSGLSNLNTAQSRWVINVNCIFFPAVQKWTSRKRYFLKLCICFAYFVH